MSEATTGGRSPPDPKRNAVLGRLPADEYQRMLAKLEPHDTKVKEPIYDLNGEITDIYFPVSSMFSLVNSISGTNVEVATVGNEGMVGLSVFFGGNTSPTRTFCQIPGWSMRMATPDFAAALAAEQDGELRRLLGMVAQLQMIQLSQNVACNRLHATVQRACRWLLLSHDRVDRDEFLLTQEFMAEMLGVRRATVSETASELQDRDLIRYRRGQLTIVDRSGLEATSCECYQAIRDHTEQLLNQ